MPFAPKGPCVEAFCPNRAVLRGRCQQHNSERNAERNTPTERGYDGAWQRLRIMKLAMDPLCQIRTHCDGITAATEVDHIIPIVEAPHLRLTMSNLQSACKSCHSAKTARENWGSVRRVIEGVRA